MSSNKAAVVKTKESEIDMKQFEAPTPSDLGGIDLESLKLNQDFLYMADVKKILTQVPIRKPHKQEFIRTNPDPNLRFQTLVINLKEDNAYYLVKPGVHEAIADQLVPMLLIYTITKGGNPFLWPVRLPGSDGRIDGYNQSAMEIATVHASNKWVRVVANRAINGYDAHVALGNLSEPDWPKESFEKILNIAFKGRIIDSTDHPVIKSLKGQL